MKVAVDFDGTICRKAKWPKMGKPVPGAVAWMKRIHKAGAKLILYTMRSGKPRSNAQSPMLNAQRAWPGSPLGH